MNNEEEEEQCCCMVVAGEVRPHQNGQLIVFDDSKLHYAFNKHPTANRYVYPGWCVLIVDVMRPATVPKGKAVGGHTDELDRFIEQYNASLVQPDDDE
ncbi:hypothetical protein AaE_003048 [Aphanomyces astaci]|uniref:Aspartyl/asparaginy/proline hydroxylase domain-containing protein n=1 Tax=Aphanomyces astaci TaxID=112090 RepID=A0A6A5AE39_APHAT|nr:hypothetical protein AaE_003048 [Aphanomyces astaci]